MIQAYDKVLNIVFLRCRVGSHACKTILKQLLQIIDLKVCHVAQLGEYLSSEGRWFESNHGNYSHIDAQNVAN